MRGPWRETRAGRHLGLCLSRAHLAPWRAQLCLCVHGVARGDHQELLGRCEDQIGPYVRAELRGRLQRLRLVENAQAFASSIEQVSSALTGSVLDASAIGALLSSGEQGQLNFADTLVQINDFSVSARRHAHYHQDGQEGCVRARC